MEEELDSAKEEIEARIQHETKITREFRTSVEEKGKLEKKIKTLQVCVCVCVCVYVLVHVIVMPPLDIPT